MANNIQTDYLQAHQEIINWVSSLKSNKATEEKMQSVLNTFYSNKNSGVADSGYLASEDMDEIIKYTEQVVNAGIDRATLSASPEAIYLQQRPPSNDIQPIPIPNTVTDNTQTFLTAREQLKKVQKSIIDATKSGNFDQTFMKKAEVILRQLENLEVKTVKRGGGYSVPVTAGLVKRLNALYSQINFGVLKSTIGDIGEYFSGAVLAAAEVKGAQGAQKITQELLQQMRTKGNLQVVGTTGKSFHYQASYSINQKDVKANLHATQDKVDVQVMFDGQMQNLSVKNYKNISVITIFKGNLLSLLAQPGAEKLLRSYSYETNNQSAYQLLKQISFIKALTGGQLAISIADPSTVITTAGVDYFVVNHQGKQFYVWSTQEIAKNILNKAGYLDQISKFAPEFPNKNLVKNNQYVSSTFKSHISMLTKSLTQGKKL